MGSCYLTDYIAENNIHVGETTGNIEKLQKKYRLGTVSNRLLGVNHVLLDKTFDRSFCSDSKHLVRVGRGF